jgi:hypothetical protein
MSTIVVRIAMLLGVENKTDLEWRVDRETQKVWVEVEKG